MALHFGTFNHKAGSEMATSALSSAAAPLSYRVVRPLLIPHCPLLVPRPAAALRARPVICSLTNLLRSICEFHFAQSLPIGSARDRIGLYRTTTRKVPSA